MTLSGKTAIVTGGGTGIGRGIALALASQSAQVVVCGRNVSNLESVCSEISDRGGKALAVACDVSNRADLERLVLRTVENFNTIDVLVNNAGLIPHGTLLEIGEDVIQSSLDVGPLAALRLMRLCHPYLRGGGSIVNVSSSVTVQSNVPNRGIYAATKATLNAISRAAANEWGGDGIRVNIVMPFARSASLERFFDEEPEYAAKVLSAVPLGRVGDAEMDIGSAVCFLVSPGASFITGATIPVDGGAAYVR